MKPQLSSITIAANDLPLLKQFYTEVFGWDIVMENPKIVILKLENTLLSLCTEDLFTSYTGTTPATGNKSYYFTINFDTRAELDAAFADLTAKGAAIKKAPAKTFWGGYAGFISDPEGNHWELSSPH